MRRSALLLSLLILSFSVSCRDKSRKDSAQKEQTDDPDDTDPDDTDPNDTDSAGDETAPALGTAISFDDVLMMSMTVEFGAATDETTAAADLEYKIVRALTSAEIDTIAEVDAVTGVDLLQDWTANSVSVPSTGLDPAEEYCYAALVRDEAENTALYAPNCGQYKLKIFVSDGSFDGDMGGVGGVDSLCMADTARPDSSIYKAFIVDSNFADLRSASPLKNWVLEASRDYYRADGTTLIGATSAQRVFAFPLANSIGTSSIQAWTGLRNDWTVNSTAECGDWKSSSAVGLGRVGDADSVSSASIDDEFVSCDETHRIICAEQIYAAKKIFITASTYNGNLGGISGADEKCMADANYPGQGIYKAIISDGTTRVAQVGSQVDWILHPNQEYVRTDNTPIGTTNADGIFVPDLTNAIGTVNARAWTSLKGPNWMSGSFNCANWSDGSAGNMGEFGFQDSVGSGFYDGGSFICNSTFALYCVEQ